jgi:hypothetical protein
MPNNVSAPPDGAPASIPRLVLAPAAVTLCVTLLRLTGEISRWSEIFFNRTMGGSLVGIVWLAPLVGIYLAVKLAKAGAGPNSFLSSVGYSVLGVIVLLVFAFAPSVLKIQHGFYDRLL